MAYTGKLQLFRGIPLNIGNEDTWYFSSRYQQELYFNSIPNITFPRDPNVQDFKFIREEGYIKVNASHDYLENCNYLRFQNEDLTGQQTTRKWYYAFVTGLKYISDTVTAVYFSLDVLQTWLPNIDYSLNQCLIEREHATSDEIGDNVATETVRAYKNETYEEYETPISGRTFYVGVHFMLDGSATGWLQLGKLEVHAVTGNDGNSYTTILGTNKVDGTVSAGNVAIFKIEPKSSTNWSNDGLEDFRNAFDQGTVLNAGAYIASEQIISMFVIPSEFIDESRLPRLEAKENGSTVWEAHVLPNRMHIPGSSSDEYWEDVVYNIGNRTIDPNFSLTKIGTRTIRNKKLLTSQYTNYVVVSPNGNMASYEPEGFTDQSGIAKPVFTLDMSATPPNKMILRPNVVGGSGYYYGASGTFEQIFEVGELPTVSARSTNFESWMLKQVTQKVNTVMPIALNAMSPALMFSQHIMPKTELLNEMVKHPAGGWLDIPKYMQRKETLKGQIATQYTQNMPPFIKSITRTGVDLGTTERPTAVACGSGNLASLTLVSRQVFNLSIRKVAPIDSEITRIDNYFNAYGYAMNVIDTPHVRVRRRFTYVKTKGARNTAKYDSNNADGIPAEYMEQINNLYDNGIRFWNEQVNFGDLTSDNEILPSNQWDN